MTNDERAQTTIDFVIGIGVFLLVVAFVVAFVPTIFEPFDETDRGTQVADRAATTLTTDALGHPQTPYVLDGECTREFFDQVEPNDPAPSRCRYNTSATTTNGVLGLDGSTGVNVTIERLEGGIAVSAVTGQRFAAGATVPEGRSITAARRVVRVENETHKLIVRVW